MFKKVEYTGFDEHPELRAKAEELTTILHGVIDRWRNDIEVIWRPIGTPRFENLELHLSLVLPNGLSATARGTLTQKDMADEDWGAIRCGRVWSDLLGTLSRQQMTRIAEFASEPAEA